MSNKNGGFSRANVLPPEADAAGMKNFLAGAETHTTASGSPAPAVPTTETSAPAAAPQQPPVAAEAPDLMHPKAKPNQALSLRLNDYQMGLIKEVARLLSKPHEKVSLQKVIKIHLLPALEQVRDEKGGGSAQ